jgi:hypothetical protein
MVMAPPYHFLKDTSKTTISYDDIEKGRRYFYRIRVVNARGCCEWSKPENRVQ